MAIKVSGTTVIDDSRNVVNVGGFKTVGGESILGTGDIPTGGGGATTRTVTDFTPGSPTTVFSVAYNPGYLDVYRNGVKLGTADFTATNGTSFTLTDAAGAGELVQAVSYTTLGIGTTTPTYQVGQVLRFDTAPTNGQWLKAGGYYSKATYPTLAAALGDIPDLGEPVVTTANKFPVACYGVQTTGGGYYVLATNGSSYVALFNSFAGAAMMKYSTDGVNWTPVRYFSGNALYEIRWLNSSKYVAAGASGIVTHSSDGLNWTLTATPTGSVLYSLAYGAGVYIAVGASASIVVSTDLVTWTQITSFPLLTTTNGTTAVVGQINRIIYANSVFVAVAQYSIITSTDGYSWSVRQFHPTAANWYDVIYANSLFVATGGNGSAYSTDGVIWKASSPLVLGNVGLTTTTNQYAFAANTAGNVLIFVGSVTTIAKRSTDGVTWQTLYVPITSGFNEIRYLNNLFVAVGNNTGTTNMAGIASSTDGITWSPGYSGVGANLVSVAYGASKYVAVGAVQGSIASVVWSTDSINWYRAAGTGAQALSRIIYAGGQFVAVGASGSIIYSSDGVTWAAASGAAGSLLDLTYGASVYAAVGNSGIYYSTNGVSWSQSSAVTTGASILFANSLFVVPLLTTAAINVLTSTDGITWTSRTTTLRQGLYDAVWTGTNYVVVGNNGVYATSTDTITWTPGLHSNLGAFYSATYFNGNLLAAGTGGVALLSATQQDVLQISSSWAYSGSLLGTSAQRLLAYDGSSKYVAVGSNSALLYSTDAIYWTGAAITNAHLMAATPNFDRVFYLNGNFIACGGSTTTTNVITSTDGVSWVYRTTTTAMLVNAMAYGLGYYVAVGSVTGAMYSTDLVTWVTASTGTTTFVDLIFANNTFVALGNNNTSYYSQTATSWTSNNLTNGSYYKVHYYNSLFITGGSSRIATSPDGITWTNITTSPASSASSIYGIADNGSLVVLVGSAGLILTSTDGVTWFQRAMTTSPGFFGITWTGNAFIAVGSTNHWYSSDGINWVQINTASNQSSVSIITAGGKTIAAGNSYISVLPSSTTSLFFVLAAPVHVTNSLGFTQLQVAYGSSKFVTVSNTSGFHMVSTDGITWSPVYYENSSTPSICWTGTRFFSVTGNYRYNTSTDGITWVPNLDMTFVFPIACCAIGNSGSVFVLGLYASAIIGPSSSSYIGATSLRWDVTIPSGTSLKNIAYNGSIYAIAASGGIIYSTDAVTWTAVVPFYKYSPISSFTTMNYVNGRFVASGGASVAYSTDGMNWSIVPVATGSGNIAYGAAGYSLCGGTTLMLASTDLVSWRAAPGATSGYDVVYANGIYAAQLGNLGANMITSTDLVTWTTRLIVGNTTVGITRLFYLNNMFLSVTGSSGWIVVSTDGITWVLTQVPINTNNTINDMAYGAGLFVVIGTGGVIATSPNGYSWILRVWSSSVTYTFSNLIWDGSKFLVNGYGSYSVMLTSTDGINWVNKSNANPSSLTNGSQGFIYYGGGKYIIAGNGMLQTSTDSVTWTLSNYYPYYSNSTIRVYLLNGIYYATTANNGVYYSTDSVTWNPIRSVKATAGGGSIAYGNGIYVIAVSSFGFQPSVIYKSTNGINWVNAADFGTVTGNYWFGITTPTALQIYDLVFASGNFILTLSPNSSQFIYSSVYTSTDAITWTPRLTVPLYSTTSSIGSDGTTAAASTGAGVLKSSDGGVTWSWISNATASVMYSNGVWITTSSGTTYLSTDLVSWTVGFAPTANGTISNFYVYNDYIVSVAGSYKVIWNKKTNNAYTVTLPNVASFPVPTPGAANKAGVLSGSTLLLAGSAFTYSYPNAIMEIPLFSYNTTTTFWIPPDDNGGGGVAYVYAGA